MSKLMMVLGIALAAVGGALGLVGITFPSKLVEHSIELTNATVMFTGGVLSFGLGALISAVEKLAARGLHASQAEDVMPSIFRNQEVAAQAPAPEGDAQRPPFMGFGKKPVEATVGAVAAGTAIATAAADAVEERVEAISPSVADTISALEQAKSDIRVALGVGNPQSQAPVSSVAIPPPHDVADDEDMLPASPAPEMGSVHEVEAAPEAEAEELFVVEEKLIRGRPARLLSDGTVEAETEEGWMRFENLEHLNEYLDG